MRLTPCADPWRDADHAPRARSRSCCSASRGGALGCWIVLYGLSYGAESLAHAMFPGLVVAALVGRAAAARRRRRARSSRRWRSRWPGGCRRRARQRRRRRGHDAVRPGRAARALARLAAGRAGPAVRRHARRQRRRPRRWPACSGVVLVGMCARLHRRLLAVGFDRAGARAVRDSRARRSSCAARPAGRRACWSAVQGLGNLLVVAVLSPRPPPRRLSRTGWRR